MGTGSLPGVKSGRVVALTPHPLLVPWSWKSRAITLLPLWAVRPVQSLSACTRVHFAFTLAIYERYWEILMVQLLVRIFTTVCGQGYFWDLFFFSKITPESTNSNIASPSLSAHEILRTEIPYCQYFDLSSPRIHVHRHEMRWPNSGAISGADSFKIALKFDDALNCKWILQWRNKDIIFF